VTAAHMAALFGEGKHPNADAITERIMDKRAGGSGRLQDVQDAIRLGQPFAVIDSAPAFRVAVAKACAQVNAGLGMPHDWPLPAAERAGVRTDVGRDMFAQEYGRPPKDPRELSSFIARHSRAATTAVAGFDLTWMTGAATTSLSRGCCPTRTSTGRSMRSVALTSVSSSSASGRCSGLLSGTCPTTSGWCQGSATHSSTGPTRTAGRCSRRASRTTACGGRRQP